MFVNITKCLFCSIYKHKWTLWMVLVKCQIVYINLWVDIFDSLDIHGRSFIKWMTHMHVMMHQWKIYYFYGNIDLVTFWYNALLLVIYPSYQLATFIFKYMLHIDNHWMSHNYQCLKYDIVKYNNHRIK